MPFASMNDFKVDFFVCLVCLHSDLHAHSFTKKAQSRKKHLIISTVPCTNSASKKKKDSKHLSHIVGMPVRIINTHIYMGEI